MQIKHEIRKILWNFGYDISTIDQTSSPLARRKKMLEHFNIETVFDIGANSGLYAKELRDDLSYSKRILSFEPLSSEFRELEKNAINDTNWEVFNFAIGDIDERLKINIAGNSFSSSILEMLPAHQSHAPESNYIGHEEIEVKKLDSIFSNLCKKKQNVYMKIDTQGFEAKVLKGAENSLPHIDTIQMEMSLVPLYEGELLFNDLYLLMINYGYSLINIEPGFRDIESGQVLQVDGIFHRL